MLGRAAQNLAQGVRMFGSTILDVATGLIFTFLAVALAASAGTEAIASILRWRSHTLLEGIKDLLNDKEFTGLARDLYNSALISPRLSGDPQKDGWLKSFRNRPSYIDPGQFAVAFTNMTIVPGPDMSPQAIKERLPVADPQIKGLLEGIIDRTAGDVGAMRAEIAHWFDAAMDRVGGAYKRWSQFVSFVVAFAIAGLLNISAIHVAKVLWEQPLIADALKPTQDARAALDELQNLPLPIGWERYLAPSPVAPAPVTAKPAAEEQKADDLSRFWCQALCGTGQDQRKPAAVVYRPWVLADLGASGWAEMIGGWLITAFAALFGAPFWFDLLQIVIRLKGSGPSPAEKKDETAAAA
jgi:hypothetical protein